MSDRDRQPPPLEWIRPPAQGRSQKTLARLLDATERLLAEQTFDKVSVADIVREARSSVGSFYGRFKSKEALLLALHERYDVESRATAERALDPAMWEGVPLADVIRGFCEFIVAYTHENVGLRRALVLGIAADDRHRESARELAAFVVKKLQRLLRARADEHSHPDPGLAAHMLHRIAFSILDQELVFHPVSPTGRQIKAPELAREMTRACSAYLGLRERSDA